MTRLTAKLFTVERRRKQRTLLKSRKSKSKVKDRKRNTKVKNRKRNRKDKRRKRNINDKTRKRNTKDKNRKTNTNSKVESERTSQQKKSSDKTRPKAADELQDTWRECLQKQWQEETTVVDVEVLPRRRIDRQGETMQMLGQKYSAVGVFMHSPWDLTTCHVTLNGPKNQVAAAKIDMVAHFHAADEQIREAVQRRREVTALLEVDPGMWHHMVGPGGEGLYKLAQEHPHGKCSSSW